MRYKYTAPKPKRHQLHGLSPSEFKSILKRRGYTFKRDFMKYGCVAKYKNRLYRFRWYSDGEFFVDKSCIMSEFDRWANSVDEVKTFYNWLES
jgi:hypothetical protein